MGEILVPVNQPIPGIKGVRLRRCMHSAELLIILLLISSIVTTASIIGTRNSMLVDKSVTLLVPFTLAGR
jgi:hypothetical protein